MEWRNKEKSIEKNVFSVPKKGSKDKINDYDMIK